MSASLSNYDLKGKRVWVAGHRGMVGSAIVRRLAAEQCEIITVGRDELDLESSHVVPALIRKIHEAKMENSGAVSVWGTGKPLRDFLYVDDCADAIVFLTKHYSAEGHVNMGSGEEISVLDLAGTIADIVNFDGEFTFDTSRPNGAPRKLLDVSTLTKMGWQSSNSIFRDQYLDRRQQ